MFLFSFLFYSKGLFNTASEHSNYFATQMKTFESFSLMYVVTIWQMLMMGCLSFDHSFCFLGIQY